jgi:hypothetical protein
MSSRRTAAPAKKKAAAPRVLGLKAVEKLEMAIRGMLSMDASLRPPASDRRRGGLISFGKTDRREVIIIGDLHGNVRNLKAILRHDGNLTNVRDDKAFIIFLGDAVHEEQSGRLASMDTSITIMNLIIHLMAKYPDNIAYIIGNHDTYAPELAKNAIRQGELYHKAVVKAHGKKYADMMQDFFDTLPAFVIHPRFLAVHGGPVRGGVTRHELINIRSHPGLLWELTWNRINETRSTPSMKEYGPQDLDDLRRDVECPPRVPVIVGHNPMWKWGAQDSIWIDPLGAHDHVILVSSHPTICPYISVKGGAKQASYEVKYADLRLEERHFVMDNY